MIAPAVHVQLALPTWGWWVVLGAFIAGEIAWECYRTQAMLENYDRTVNDADLGARGVEQLTEHLADLRSEITDAMLDHAEQLDALRDRLAVTAPPVRTDTDIAAAVLVGHWADGLEQRPTPHKRARTTEGETTDA